MTKNMVGKKRGGVAMRRTPLGGGGARLEVIIV